MVVLAFGGSLPERDDLIENVRIARRWARDAGKERRRVGLLWQIERQFCEALVDIVWFHEIITEVMGSAVVVVCHKPSLCSITASSMRRGRGGWRLGFWCIRRVN